jgi:hypothetical protein
MGSMIWQELQSNREDELISTLGTENTFSRVAPNASWLQTSIPQCDFPHRQQPHSDRPKKLKRMQNTDRFCGTGLETAFFKLHQLRTCFMDDSIQLQSQEPGFPENLDRAENGN